MSAYKVSDLLNVLRRAANEGLDYISVRECEEDEDLPAALLFEAIHDYSSGEEFDEIESVEIPDDYILGYSSTLNADAISSTLVFDFSELCTLMSAVENALAFSKIRLNSSDCSKAECDAIKDSSIDLRNLQAKLAKFRKKYRIKKL